MLLLQDDEARHGRLPSPLLLRTRTSPGFLPSLVHRSFSLPSFRRLPTSTPRHSLDLFIVRPLSSTVATPDGRHLFSPDDAEVFEEESVCRICMLELNEGNETFKMECSCKGELALAHKECTVKWFSMKGNNQCDICNTRVCNLPVLLFRRTSSLCHNNIQFRDGEVARESSSWRQTVMVFLSSTLESLWHKLEELSEFP